jgi:hypothetical protein
MKFLSVYTPKDNGTPPSPELIAKMGKLIEEGMKSGWLLATEGVCWGTTPTEVRSDRGEISVVDGPFAEAKEVIGGFAILQASSREEVIGLTRRFLAVAGDGTCLVQQLYEAPAGHPQ